VCGKVESQPANIFSNRATVVSSEDPREMCRMDAGSVSDIFAAKLLREVIAEKLLGPAQPGWRTVIAPNLRARGFNQSLVHQAFDGKSGQVIGVTKLSIQAIADPIDRFRASAGTRFEDLGVGREVRKTLRAQVHTKDANGPVLIFNRMRFFRRMKDDRGRSSHRRTHPECLQVSSGEYETQ